MHGRAVRVAAHVHSTWSYDGTIGLAQLARMFSRLGCEGVLLSEHDRGYDEARWADFRAQCVASSLPGMPLVPGMEYSDPDNDVHVLVWGCEAFLGAGLPTDHLLARLADHDALAVLAHPSRRSVITRLPRATLERFDGIEVWNRKYDGVRPDDDAVTLAAELGALAFVGLDLHTRRQLFPLTIEVDVGTRAPSADAIVDAIRRRGVSARALGAPLHRSLSPNGRRLLANAERARRVAAARRRARRPAAG